MYSFHIYKIANDEILLSKIKEATMGELKIKIVVLWTRHMIQSSSLAVTIFKQTNFRTTPRNYFQNYDSTFQNENQHFVSDFKNLSVGTIFSLCFS